MPHRLSAAVIVAATLLAGCVTEPAGTADLAFRHVNVVTMASEEILEDRAVLVSGDRIIAIEPERRGLRRFAAIEIDGQGGYLIPGLSDMHAHLGLILPWDGDPDRKRKARDLCLYVPLGVTRVRNMRGTPGDLELRAELDAGMFDGPDLFLAGPSLHSDMPEAFGPKVTTAEEAERVVREQKEAGYDLIKVHGNLPQAAFDAVIKTANELGVATAGHVQSDKSTAENARLGSIEHMEEIAKILRGKADFSEAPEMLADIAASGAYVTPTLVVFDTIAKYLDDDALAALYSAPETAYVSEYWKTNMAAERNFFRQLFGENFRDQIPALEKQSAQHLALTRQLHDAGVPLLLGTDAVGLVAPAASVHQELALLVEAGLTPFEALQTATVNPARWAGSNTKEGVIAIGARADLVLLSGDPLLDIAATKAIRGVMRRGEWRSRAALDAALTRCLQGDE